MSADFGAQIDWGNKISASLNFLAANNILVENIVNSSTSEKEDVNSSSGILFSGCKDIVVKNYSIGNLFSHSGVARHFTYKMKNEGIII